MELILNLIERERPANLSQYGNYLCLIENYGQRYIIVLSWGMRGWFERGVGCYGDNGEKVIAHAYLDELSLNK